MTRRVVITGAGTINPIGAGVEEFWQNSLAGITAVSPVPQSWARYATTRSRFWSTLPASAMALSGLSRSELLTHDPVAVLALGAAREALHQSGLASDTVATAIDAERTGVFLGTGLGGAVTFLRNHTHHLGQRTRALLKARAASPDSGEDQGWLNEVIGLLDHGPRFNPFEVSMVMPNSPAAAMGIRYGFKGPNTTYCVACSSGMIAIGNAYRAVRDERVDTALAGGCEYFGDDHGHIFRSFDIAGALVQGDETAERCNRPFDQQRSGFLFSQGGAAVLVLEELEHARRRGATILAEIIGYAETFDAYSMMSMPAGGEQVERMMRLALADAGVGADEVDYLNAHGTGTEINDRVEAETIERVFGRRVLVNTTKSLLGHTIGASGAIEALVTALSLKNGTTHICRNLENPVRDLNFARKVESHDLRVGLTQSFAFGGHNAALVLRRYP